MSDYQTDPEWRAEEVEFNTRLGRNISAARLLAGLTQEALASAAGLTYSRVIALERANGGFSMRISINELQQIADVLGVTAISLLPTLRERIAR